MNWKYGVSICAAMLVIMGCSDDSSGSAAGTGGGEGTGECSPECTTGFHCSNGECVKDGETQPPETTSPCDSCKDNEICVDNACKACENGVCNGVCCDSSAPCEGSECSNSCDACTTDQICTEEGCKACPNPVCKNICCAEDEACDLFTGECAPSLNEQAACNGLYCAEEEVCTETGECSQMCDSGNQACGPERSCCQTDETCFEDSYCRVVCSEDRVMCGKAHEEVCCEAGQVCENDKCLNACEGTRCGENLEYCCDNAVQVCAYNHCVKPTSENTCQTNDDCDLWSFCDTGSSRCISQDEDTNACIYRPPVGEFKPKIKWHWMSTTGVMSTPIVINLTDDNGDGKVDENDTPDVVFTTNSGQLFALDGGTGKELASSGLTDYNNYDDMAAGDIDNDGKIEVLVPTATSVTDTNPNIGLKILTLEPKADGGYEWKDKHYIKATHIMASNKWSSVYSVDLHPTIADVDGDGKPDIVTTNGIIKGDGDWSSFFCDLNFPATTIKPTIWFYVSFFAVADLDQDGSMEIIMDDIYDNECNSIAKGDSKQWNYVAVADLVPDDGDPANPGELVPEIVRVRGGSVSVWKVYKNDGKWSQKLVWEKPQTSTNGGGNPVVADFDGDGKPDIGVAGRTHISVFNGQTGDIVWASKTQDASSESTGAAVFDFEGDGIAEVVYRDEVKVRIYAGPGAGKDSSGKIIDKDGDGYMDAKILWEAPRTSGTIIDYPLIVDVDNDGRTEIVVTSSPTSDQSDGTGITVYGDTYDNWVRTRRIWNEHAYHVTNINEDGTVPQHEQANWLNKRLNNYRANTQPSSGFNAPNFQPAGLSVSDADCAEKGILKLTATVKNAGSLGVSVPVAVSFYIYDYVYEGKKYNVYLGTALTTGTLPPDGTADARLDWNGKGTIIVNDQPVEITVKGDDLKITYIVDDAHDSLESYISFSECIEDDNSGISDVVKLCPPVVN